MRIVLALLAVIGLLASPVTAAAAQAACRGHGEMAMAGMPMDQMAGMHQTGAQKADPCCDQSHGKGQPKHDQMSCVQACAVMCGVAAGLPMSSPVAPHPLLHSTPPPDVTASLHPHEPNRLERPPKSIA